jgi:G3E family GTPase
VDLLTGFLGAGKTTLLSHVLQGSLSGEKVAVVMNEIGDIGIDGRVITGMDYVENVVELNSGCICCTIDDYRFDLAVQELIEAVDPTLLIIESTGVADPEPMLYRIKQAGLGLDAVITVVDAANLDRALKETSVARAQVAAADFIVINKVDLLDARGLGRVARKVTKINPRAVVFESERCRVQSPLLFGTSTRNYRRSLEAGASEQPPPKVTHLDEDGISAFSYDGGGEFDQKRFERFLDRLPANVYRAKGFVRLAGNDWSCLFNYTCGRYEISWVKVGAAAASTQAVFIGRDLEGEREKILDKLLDCKVD